MVVTLKTVSDAGPLPLESHFISSWLRMSFLLLLFLVGLGFLKSYNGLLLSQYEDKSAPSLYCQELSTAAVKDASRLDAALSLYLLNDLSPACLEKEAEVSLWSATRDDQGLAYLAKYLVSDPSTQKEYLAKLCTEPTSSYCSMALYMSEDRSLENLSVADSQLWVAQVLLAEEKYARADYDGSLRIIESLQKNEILKTSLEKRFVRAVWALQNSSIQKGRTPASVKHNETWIEKFKERYEVP